MRPRRAAVRPPAKGSPVGPMTDGRRKLLGLSGSPGRDRAIGLAFWAGFAVLVLHYLGIIPVGQPTAADIWPPPSGISAPR